MKMNESRWNHRVTQNTSRAVKGQTEVIVRHTESMNEKFPGMRSHPGKIKAIFVQSKEGERWKSPFNYPDLGFAMANHVDHGGVPHDPAGKAIINMAEQILQLSKFQKEIKQATLHDDALGITERAVGRLNELKTKMKALSKRQYYEQWMSEFDETKGMTLGELDPVTLETYKDKFTNSSFNENLASYFPLIHSIMQETNTIDLEDYVDTDLKEDVDEITLNGKPVNIKSLEIDGVDRRDHPDYADAYFSYGEYADGTQLTDQELDALTDERGDIVNQMANMRESSDEIQQFEQWAEAVEQGTLAPDQIAALKAKLTELEGSGQPLEFGPEGSTAIAFFADYGINSETFPETQIQALEEKLRQDAEDSSFDETANPLDTLKVWANEHQPNLVAELGLEQPEPEQPAADATATPPSDSMPEPAAVPAPEEPVAESKNDWLEEVAKLVKSRYNQANETIGPFKGYEGIALDIKKQISEKFGEKIGEKAELVAKKYMENLMKQWESIHNKPATNFVDEDDGLAKLRELLDRVKAKVETIDPKNPRDYEKPAYMRKQDGQAPLTMKDIDDKDNASPTTAAGLAKRKAELGIDENVSDILKLAGLAK